MNLAELSSILWRERDLLELLLFKLEEEQLVLSAGRTRWLAHATREVETVLEQIRLTEVLRAAEVAVVGADLGLGSDASLAQLADAVVPPWSELLRQHRTAFLALTAEINALSEANRQLLTAGQRAVNETLMMVGGAGQTYSRHGETLAAVPRTRLLDEAM